MVTEKRACFWTDSRYFEMARASVKNAEVRLSLDVYSQISEALKEEKVEEILLETDFVTVAALSRIKNGLDAFVIAESNFLSHTIARLRSVKDKRELEFIEKAQAVTDKAFQYILTRIKEGVTEKQIALDLEFFIRTNGGDGLAFDIIAVSGKNSSLPHGVPTDKPLEKGDFLTLDFGAKYNGYCSDMTRTVALGFVADKQKTVYETVLKAQKAAIESIKAGVPCKDVDAVARNIIDKAGFGGKFGHGLGHSLGIAIHESPACNTRDITPLTSGTVMTVEPGIYLEGEFGVRIEDMVIVTKEGCINLTKSPKELIII